MPVAAAPEARPPADVAALTAALEAAAQTVEVRLDTKGRVRALEVRQWERAAAFVNSYPEPYVRAFVTAHGDRFGYGPLGEASDDIALNDEELGGPASLLVPYPKAQGCPGLAVLFRYTYGHDVTGLVGMPLSWEVLCPTEPGALHRIQEAREQGRGDVAGSRAVTAALKDEPIVRWLVDHGFGRPTMVAREKDRIRVGLRYLGGPETRKPEALALFKAAMREQPSLPVALAWAKLAAEPDAVMSALGLRRALSSARALRRGLICGGAIDVEALL